MVSAGSDEDVPMQVGTDKVVTIEYTLRSDAGDVLDTSKGRGPLTYLHGAGNLIPGLESALDGKQAGDSMTVEVAPEEAYGHKDDQLVQQVPRNLFSGPEQIQPGMQFQAQTQAGPRVVTVVNIEGDTVTIDANHPLAGMPLTFDVTVVDVRDATEEEKAHGHVHGPGGHEH
jgi:FKBP-type peptidyl-prolyl cis-trans isomerase SlyD